MRALFSGRSDDILHAIESKIETHSAAEHFEAAARLRDRTVTVVRALRRTQRLAALTRIPELIAAHPDGAGGWHFAVIRHGRLASAGNAPRGVSPMLTVDHLAAAAETVIPPRLNPPPRTRTPTPTPGTPPAADLDAEATPTPVASDDPAYPPLHGALPEEAGLLVRWLEQPGTRIVRTTDGYHEPRLGAGAWLAWMERAEAAASATIDDPSPPTPHRE